MKKLWIIGVALLWLGLSSCGALAQVPPEEAVRIGVIQQLANAQNEISQQLDLPVLDQPNFKVDKLTISRREKIKEPAFETKGYPADIYRVAGTVETTLMMANGKTQQTGPFEILLGTTPAANAEAPPAVETWYLIPQKQLQ